MEVKTIHIFGYGETQIVGKDTNKKVLTSSLTSAQAVIDNVYGKKPTDVNAGALFFTINIHIDMFSDYIPEEREEKHFRTPYSELDSALIDALISEIEATIITETEAE